MAQTRTTYRVACSGALPHSEIWANIWHVRSEAAAPTVWDADDAAFIADAFEAFYTEILGLLDPTWTLTQIQVGVVGTAPPEPIYVPYNLVGTGTGGPLPNQTAVVLSLGTAQAGRSGRGRIYLGGFAESSNSGGSSSRLSSTSRDTIGGAATGLNTTLLTTPGGFGPNKVAVYSRVLDESFETTQFRVGTVFDTQRRRRNRSAEQFVSFAAE